MEQKLDQSSNVLEEGNFFTKENIILKEELRLVE